MNDRRSVTGRDIFMFNFIQKRVPCFLLKHVTRHQISYFVFYFSWGMGTNGQLGTGEDEDVWSPTVIK